MSQGILSPPAGLLSDEDVVVSPMFESTAADLGSVIRKNLLSECSVISTSLEDKQQVKGLESGICIHKNNYYLYCTNEISPSACS
jgi:kinesin family protein 20